MTKETFAVIGVRLIALLFVSGGVLLLLGNVLETAWDFNPNYLGYYFATQLLRPLLTLLTGAVLYATSGKIAQAIGKE